MRINTRDDIADDEPRDGAARAVDGKKELTAEQIFAYRQTHEGKDPPGVGAAAKDGKEWTGEDLFAYRQTHGGKNPPGYSGGAR